MSPPEPELDIVEPLCAVFRRRLKAEGAKYTPERAQILDVIIRIDGFFEVETILERLREGEQRVSKATVYRTIKLLQDAGLVQRVPVEGDQAQYMLVYGKSPTDLLIRMDTGQAFTIEVPELEAIRERICAERGLRAEGHRLQIFAMPADNHDRSHPAT